MKNAGKVSDGKRQYAHANRNGNGKSVNPLVHWEPFAAWDKKTVPSPDEIEAAVASLTAAEKLRRDVQQRAMHSARWHQHGSGQKPCWCGVGKDAQLY